MKKFLHIPLLFSITFLASHALAEGADKASISIQVNGTQLPMQGLEPFFTGPVRVEPLFQAKGEARAAGATVTFEPGSRTNWHTHPVGQTLVVTYGKGWVQQWHGRRLVIAPGDVVHIPANVKHWHGATDSTAMVHLAIQESQNGKVVTWMEAVSDSQYKP
ncbi:(R)-mandelonitrile lyase [Pseudoalteromonas sp. GB56]